MKNGMELMDEKKLDVIINSDCSLFLMFVAEHSIFDVALVNDILNLGKQKALEIRNPDTLQEKIILMKTALLELQRDIHNDGNRGSWQDDIIVEVLSKIT